MRNITTTLLAIFFIATTSSQTISVTLPATAGTKPFDGRLFLLLSTNGKTEPRFQINDGAGTQMIFGTDVEDWKPGTPKQITSDAFGYPVERISEIKPGVYYAQVLLHVYETFHRKDGHVLKLPMDRGEGQHWNKAPGNLYSEPVQITIDNRSKATIALVLSKTIPPIKPPEDTRFVKHIRIQSKRLSEFWGQPIYIGAHILLPEGWDTHPNVKYPLAIFHGHFPGDFENWRTTPPDSTLKPDTSERFHIAGYNRITQEEEYRFYKQWTGPNFPRVLAIQIQHPTQYYDDSYAVNSENMGPYGDAITYELIPEIEKRFRGIGQGWARFMYGGSTGGWEVLAAQVFYPAEYNGCYAACPDPIDFRNYTVVDIYHDKNAYYLQSEFKKTPRAGMRDYLGRPSNTLAEVNHLELALGNKSRSGEQWDIWEAVFSPAAKDGYPQRIWDKYTGEINKDVASYWHEHFDLAHIIARDWPKIGEQLKGKIHIYAGDMDNYYLNNAVMSAEDVLKKLQQPACSCQVDYGDGNEHCWNGDHTLPNYITRLRYHSMFISKWAEEVKTRAPQGADLDSWRY